MNCVHCGSSDIRKLEVIFREGTIAVGGGGTAFTTPTGSVVQTDSARRSAPPADPQRNARYISAIIAAIWFMACQQFKFLPSFDGLIMDSLYQLLSAVLVFLVCYVIWLMSPHGKSVIERHEVALEQWHRSWKCSKCGDVTVAGH